MKTPSLSHLLKKKHFPEHEKKDATQLEFLQHRMLRIQQGIWHGKRKVVVLFEGFDASGKGGAIRRLVEPLDPRGFQVHPIGPPIDGEVGEHYLQRFWARLPKPGSISIFDRSWYGRVLVERVEKLTPKERCQEAYGEIIEFEKMLLSDGIDLIKIFLAIDKKEQFKRFEDRLQDPYKQWKISEADVEARARWDAYVDATDRMFQKTHTKKAPWNLIAANDKHFARMETLRIVTGHLDNHSRWMESRAQKGRKSSLEADLKHLGRSK